MKDKKSFLAVEITVNGDGKATGAKAGKSSRSMAVQRLKFASDPLHVALCWCSIPSSLQLHRSFVSRLAADHDATNSIFIPVWHLGPLAVVIAGKRLAVEQQTLSPAPRNEWTFIWFVCTATDPPNCLSGDISPSDSSQSDCRPVASQPNPSLISPAVPTLFSS